MSEVTIKFRDGTERKFVERGRAGCSYSVRVRYEGAFVIVVDEWESTSAFPVDLVASVETYDRRGGW